MNEMIRSVTAAGVMALLLGTQAAVSRTGTSTQDAAARLDPKPAWGQLCKKITPSTDEYQLWLDPMTVQACRYMESPQLDRARHGNSASRPDPKGR